MLGVAPQYDLDIAHFQASMNAASKFNELACLNFYHNKSFSMLVHAVCSCGQTANRTNKLSVKEIRNNRTVTGTFPTVITWSRYLHCACLLPM